MQVLVKNGVIAFGGPLIKRGSAGCHSKRLIVWCVFTRLKLGELRKYGI
jgi:hypothetical protein